MLKLIRNIIVFLLIPAFAYAGGAMGLMMVGGTTTTSTSYTYTENFNATTEPNPPTSWVVASGNPDWDADPTGLDMEGTQCVSEAATVSVRTDFALASDFYATFKIRFNEAIESAEIVCTVADSAAGALANVYYNADGTFKVNANGGATSGNTTETIALGASGYIKIRFIQGTANDAKIYLWVWNGSAWGTVVSSLNGTSENAPERIYVKNNADTETMYFDYFIYHTSDISSPAP